jgi:MarR family transcriptional regulator, lower aerobic nicotinate degradation pathway regulator
MAAPRRAVKSDRAVERRVRTAKTVAEELAAASYKLEEQVGFKLRKVQQRATEIFNDVMRDFDLTPMQFAILAKLDDLGTVSQNQLGRHAAMDPATTFGVVGRLLKRGLLRQSADKSDARLILITLTEDGQRLVTRMKEIGVTVSERTLQPLTEDEARTFLALLTKLE